MRLYALALVSLALVPSFGCSSGPASNDAVASNPIQGGESDTGDPAVGLIEFTNGSFCTGSLIAPDLVLTAGHCTLETPAAFYIGTDKSSATKHSIAKVAPFPGYRATNTCPNPTIDVALMQLSSPVVDVAPLTLSNHLPKPGDTCTAIGFGRHGILADAGDSDAAPVVLTTQYEQKRDATELVTVIGSTAIEVTYGSGLADHGDSGGPLVCGGTISATVSCHTDGDYPTHQNEYYARIDTIAGWISAMETSFDPSAPWPPVAANDAGSNDDASAFDDDAGNN